MTGRFRHEVDLDAPVERVVAVLLDPASYVARYEASGGTGVEVVSREVADDGGITLVSRRAEVGGSLPAPIAKLVRGAAQLTQTERWAPPSSDGSRRADWTVEAKGVPVDIGGTTEVRPHGGGARLIETGSVTAHVRLVGALVEKVAVEQSGGRLQLEWAWLQGQL